MSSNFILFAIIGALLLPTAWSLSFCFWALRSPESDRIANWALCLRRMRALNLLAVPAWWSLSGMLIELGAKRNLILDVPQTVLLVLPLSVGITAARFLTYLTDNRIDSRRWTIRDMFRLSVWSSLSSTVPLLLFAAGIDALCRRNLFGVLWIGCAGLLSSFAKVSLRLAEGLKPRIVKSGELFKRSFVLAKQMGVHLVGVFVYATGRGGLTNAHGGAGFIGMTDVCIHWLHGSQIDFVIGHELAHSLRKHGQKARRIAVGVYLATAALALALPHLALVWQVILKFTVILVPLLVFYSVSRRFEFEADRIAVELTGEGEAAIRGLANLYYRSGVPTDCAAFDELLSTHPDLSSRINAIARIGKVPIGRVAVIRQEFNERAGGSSLPDGAE